MAKRKFTPDDVRHIRAAVDGGQSIHSLATEFNVNWTAIKLIASGQTYKDVANGQDVRGYSLEDRVGRLEEHLAKILMGHMAVVE